MKRIFILFAAAVALTMSAHAKSILVDRSDGVDTYLDPDWAVFSDDHNSVTFFLFTEKKKTGGKTMALLDMDCLTRRYRVMALNAWVGNSSTVPLLREPTDWRDALAGSVESRALDYLVATEARKKKKSK